MITARVRQFTKGIPEFPVQIRGGIYRLHWSKETFPTIWPRDRTENRTDQRSFWEPNVRSPEARLFKDDLENQNEDARREVSGDLPLPREMETPTNGGRFRSLFTKRVDAQPRFRKRGSYDPVNQEDDSESGSITSEEHEATERTGLFKR